MEINKPTTTVGGSTKVEPTYAFPMVGQIVTKVNPITGQQDIMSFVQTGMELRDYFAGQIAPSIADKLTKFYNWGKGVKNDDDILERVKQFNEMIARDSYSLADAMLAERSKVKS